MSTSGTETYVEETQKTTTLDAATAQELISSFFPLEWATTSASSISIQNITGGLVNTLHLVRRSSPSLHEPQAILIRHFGHISQNEDPHADDVLTLSAVDQALVACEMGRRGWGPKVHGIFQGGRLEEWIEGSRTFHPEDVLGDVGRGVARGYARFHSLEMPIRRDGFERVVKEFRDGVRGKREKVLDELRAVKDSMGWKYALLFEEMDWLGELAWVVSLIEQFKCRKTLTHGDSNHLNILIWSSAHKEDALDSVVLIDYEMVSYSYRGIDIGGHFNERMYCYTQPDTQLTGYPPPNSDEQRGFCETYIHETRELKGMIEEGDTVEQLLLEAKIGQLCHLLFTNLMLTVLDEVEIEPVFLEGMVHMMETYGRLKEEFIRGRM
ncbi:uncharacterized protein RCC_03875 [Ramularia collo-cygni]|uniref:Choline kinase n=1 Tax=Ramularia collo-cygni TaxID=112498 RepID=A0A2D3V033_9PEZI|nr:uncharacterized protein RCC_03875 [Ramularia collo-cygni]CZT18037.1 uncharacterized protein RCC_03875 [Ramularia collo-cygni]